MHRRANSRSIGRLTVIPRWEWRMSDAGFVPAESTFAGPAPGREVDTLEQLLGDLLAGRADVLALRVHKRQSPPATTPARA